MADRVKLVAQRGGNRGSATLVIAKIRQIDSDDDLSRPRKIHELEKKLSKHKDRLSTIEDLDNQIIEKTEPEENQDEIDSADTVNMIFRDARDLAEFAILQYQ